MTDPVKTLNLYRAQIDAIDDQLSQLLIERMGIIRNVAALKAEHWPGVCHIRPGREGHMHRAIADRFTGSGFPPLAGLAIWRQLIGASTHLESPLNITYLNEFPEHRWLGREYFGLQVGDHPAATLADAVAHMQSGASNLLLLPAPTHHEWWKDAAAIRAAGVYIFAALPVAAGNVPRGAQSAVALAAVSPEDSGDDISYFLRGDRLEVIDGFASQREHATFLGAHPRPVKLEKKA